MQLAKYMHGFGEEEGIKIWVAPIRVYDNNGHRPRATFNWHPFMLLQKNSARYYRIARMKLWTKMDGEREKKT
jgi:hypothetical protein